MAVCHTEQDLVALAVSQSVNELVDGGLLVAAGGVRRCQSESHGLIGGIAGRAPEAAGSRR